MVPSSHPFPIAAAIDGSPNGRKRRGTFYIFPYTRDDETGIRSLARSESPQGGWKAAFLPSRSHLPRPSRFSSRIQRNFWILISPKVLLFLKVYLYSTGTREGKGGGNWGARIPRNVSSKRGALKSFVARLIKGFVVRPIVNQFKSEEQEIAPSKKREKRRDDP